MFDGASPLSIGRNPIPCIPFPLPRGRGVSRKRGFAPLRHPIKGVERVNTGSFRGTSSLLHNHLPLSFEGEGDKGGEVDG